MAPTIRKPFRPRAVVFVWDGEVMRPLPRFADLCDRQFAVHEEYPMQIVENRSLASHNHYFAAVAEAWQNLNEGDAKRFPHPEALRAWALVQCGYATQADYACETARDARTLATALRRMSPLAIIQIRGNVVRHFEAESQSMAAMKRDRFEQSKADVLALVAGMARTTPAELKKNAGKHA